MRLVAQLYQELFIYVYLAEKYNNSKFQNNIKTIKL